MLNVDFRKRIPEPQTLSMGCCIKWNVEEERRFYKTSSFNFGDDESTSELIVSDLLKNSPFPFVAYHPCQIHLVYRNEERIEKGVWSDSFLAHGEKYLDMFTVLELKGMKRQFDNHMTVGERYNFTVQILSEIINDDAKPFLDFMFSLDYVIGNWDRHCGNFGLIKQLDKKYRLAPIFDNGLSLWAKKRIPGEECEPFSSWAQKQIVYTKSKLFLDFISTQPIDEILKKYEDCIDVYKLDSFVSERITKLRNLLTQDNSYNNGIKKLDDPFAPSSSFS